MIHGKKLLIFLSLILLNTTFVSAQLEIFGFDNQRTIELKGTSELVSSASNVSSVQSGDNCIFVSPTTGNVVITFNTSCGGSGGGTDTNFFDLIGNKLVNLTTEGIDTTQVNVTGRLISNHTLIVGAGIERDLGSAQVVIYEDHSSLSTVRNSLRLERFSSGGTVADGMGLGIDAHLEDDGGALEPAGRLLFKWADVSEGLINFVIQLRNETTDAIEDRFIFSESGRLNATTDFCITSGNCLSSAGGISSSTANATYLKLDATNDPLTSNLTINGGSDITLDLNATTNRDIRFTSSSFDDFRLLATGSFFSLQYNDGDPNAWEIISLITSGSYQFVVPTVHNGAKFNTVSFGKTNISGAGVISGDRINTTQLCLSEGSDCIDDWADVNITTAITNIFNQSLNTTDNVQFRNINIANMTTTANLTLEGFGACNAVETNSAGQVFCDDNIIAPANNKTMKANSTDVTYTADKAVTHNISMAGLVSNKIVSIQAQGYLTDPLGGSSIAGWTMNIKNSSGAIIGTSGCPSPGISDFNTYKWGCYVQASDSTPFTNASYYIHLDEVDDGMSFVMSDMQVKVFIR